MSDNEKLVVNHQSELPFQVLRLFTDVPRSGGECIEIRDGGANGDLYLFRYHAAEGWRLETVRLRTS